MNSLIPYKQQTHPSDRAETKVLEHSLKQRPKR